VSELVIFIVTGLTTGAVYSLAGVGLVLTFKTSGVFNFAHGALAAIAAYCFFELFVSRGLPWQVAALVAVVGVGGLMGILLEPFAGRLRKASLPMQVAGTVGLLLAIQAIIALVYPDDEYRVVPTFLHEGGFDLVGAPVQWVDVITLAVAVVATVVVTLVLRSTRAGMATRALVDNDELLGLNGISPSLVRRGAWVAGSMLAALSGVLFAPLLPLNSTQLTLLVVAAFGAAAVGRFSSLPFTFVGGLLIGVGSALLTRYASDPLFEGVAPSLPFLVLFLVLLFSRRPGPAFKAQPPFRSGAAWSAPAPVQLALGAVVVVLLAAVPTFAGIHLTEWTAAIGGIVLFLSLALLVRTSGQVSLCHVAFMAIGAASFSHFTTGIGMPWFVALVAAGALAVPVGAVLAIPAIRLSGLHLALATFGFGILLQYMFYQRDFMFGDSLGGGLAMPRPSLGGGPLGDTAYYYLALALCALAAAFVVGITRGRLGRLLRGLGNAPTALETTGTAVNVTRVLVFCISGGLAAVAGVMIGVARSTVSSNDFQPLASLTLLALVMIVIGRAPWDAVMAGLALYIVPSYVSGGDIPIYMQLLFGVSAVALAVLPPGQGGPPAVVREWLDRTFQREPRRLESARTQEAKAPAPAAISGSGLQASGVVVRFGGAVALNNVDLEVPLGRVTGLIGPNGAGKTTFFNAVSGLVRPAVGTVYLDGREVTGNRPGARAREGLGRTFQDMRLFESLSVLDNVALGREGAYAGTNPLTHLAARPADKRTVRKAAYEAIELCGLSELALTPVHGLSTGQRRLVDLARCLAGDFRVLLLDEPSSGLDVNETRQLGDIIRRVVEERGVGVLLVEHDLPLVLSLCEDIYVLDFGQLIFHGTPDEVTDSPLVRAAYLGDDLPAVTASEPRKEGAL
jgi:ABC-type branched-subunit amino acid transport system ATPase component/branched-subunit amino acid ABC-type transport system permease component